MIEKYIKVDLLGSTGSIGKQAIDVIRKLDAKITCVCANVNYRAVEAQVREFKPKFCAMFDYEAAKQLKQVLADTNTKVLHGESGICEMISHSDADVALNAIIGKAGLLPTLAIINQKKSLALANKESLVVAGRIVMKAAQDNGVSVIPVDSEHCAIHQCLQNNEKKLIKKLIVTASGGPFFGKTTEQLKNIDTAKALLHPTWSMGNKITIDSATLINKGFELIEASHLFEIAIDRIQPIVHRESIIHSMVEYIDNTIIAQMSVPDMKACIQYGICKGKREDAVIDELDLAKIANLSFYAPDYETFPLLKCAIDCQKSGGAMPAILNASNEIAVDAFLNNRISFLSINELVLKTVEHFSYLKQCNTLSEFLDADNAAREYTKLII